MNWKKKDEWFSERLSNKNLESVMVVFAVQAKLKPVETQF